MRRLLFLIILLTSFVFVGCSEPINKECIIKQTVKDKEYIEGHYETVAKYTYQPGFGLTSGKYGTDYDLKYVQEYVPDDYKIIVDITYDTGEVVEWTYDVSKTVYKKYEIGDEYEE